MNFVMVEKRPNFFIIGAAKSGTSSIYRYLNQHPEIFMSPTKEPHFFSFREKAVYSNGPGDLKRMQGATGDLGEYLRLFSGVKSEKCVGEASTTYLDSLDAPSRLKAFCPHGKIIAILRNPVDRAFSSYMHLRRDGAEERLDFKLALAAEESRINAKWSILWHYKTRQFSYEKLLRYYNSFPKAQIRVYEYENWKKNNAMVLKDIFRFLDVDENINIDLSAKYNVGGVPRSDLLHRFLTKRSVFKEVLKRVISEKRSWAIKRYLLRINLDRTVPYEKIRRDLIALYREDIEKVQELCHLDLSHWMDGSIKP